MHWEYHTLSVRWEYHSESIILSVCCTETLIACWEYDDTLSTRWYSEHAPQRALRISYSQRCTLRHTLRAERFILSASYSQHALIVSLMLRVWYSHAESIILSAANSGGYKKINKWQSSVSPLNNFDQQCLNGAADWSVAKGGQVLPLFEHIVSGASMLLCPIAAVF
jgi:hypothetical protein